MVLKAQVETGGRGKAGGIRIVNEEKELLGEADAVLNLVINGLAVKRLYIVKALEVKREFYISFIFDRSEKVPLLIFSKEGGVDINQTADENPDEIITV